jgi:hypothetical protein
MAVHVSPARSNSSAAGSLPSDSADQSVRDHRNDVSRLLPADAPTWAEHFVQLVVASSQTSGWVRPVLPLRDAMQLTGHKSISAFYRWLEEWAPKACCSHGRYTRTALIRGLDKEAMQTRPRRVVLAAANVVSAAKGR